MIKKRTQLSSQRLDGICCTSDTYRRIQFVQGDKQGKKVGNLFHIKGINTSLDAT